MRDAAKGSVHEMDGPRSGAATETLQLFGHDIRSAMSDVIGGLRLVDRHRLDPEARMQIDRVQSAGDTLASLVDAALMAAMGETLIASDNSPLVLREWLDAMDDRWAGRAREARALFAIETGGVLPAAIRAPQMTLDRIIGNLIGNSLTHAGGAPVTLRLAGARGQGLSMTVRDAGPGYPAEILARMSAGQSPVAMGARAGSGLGLRIAAELAEQLGAHLSFSNQGPGGGGCAILEIPESVLDWTLAEQTPCVMPDLSDLRLLVAEDNMTNQAILKNILAQLKADVTFASDGLEAVECLQAESFDLALIDIEMPKMTGLEVMQSVRARRDEAATMPMVALTAYVLRDNREAIYAAGADGIIGKPIASPSEFGQAILRYAGRPAGKMEPEDVLSGKHADLGDGRKMDEERFGALLEVAGDEGREELLQRLHEDLCSVRDALDQGVAGKSVPEIRSQTHILIAISGAIGAERLHRLAEVLNIAAKRKRFDDLSSLYRPCRTDLVDLITYVMEQAQGLGTRLTDA